MEQNIGKNFPHNVFAYRDRFLGMEKPQQTTAPAGVVSVVQNSQCLKKLYPFWVLEHEKLV